MYGNVKTEIRNALDGLREAGLEKGELIITSSQDTHVDVLNHGHMLNLCANNYLGLANHPEIIAAAHEALDRWGYGMASVRFICGTQAIHRELEERLAAFLGTDDVVLFNSCFDANGGLFETLLDENDAVISDALNHASIIDGIRLCKARRLRYANGDIDELEQRLIESGDARRRLIATDGVFSMDGYLAKLDDICRLADRYNALVMVDDSHAVGVVGADGRGTAQHFGVTDRIDILTGTLGKAIGGASGGYIAAHAEIIALLRQRARPYLFSNSVAPPVVAASLRALELIETNPALRQRLDTNTRHFRSNMTANGFEILPGDHPIVPVMIGNEVEAAHFAEQLIQLGVYAVSFSYPVVPNGQARIRTQMSAAHTEGDLDHAITAFMRARERANT